MADVTTREQSLGAVVARYRDEGDGTHAKSIATNQRIWDTTNLVWVRQGGDASGTSAVSSTGGAGGGAATIADGADVAQGSTTDLSSANTVVGILKAIKAAITGTLTVSGPVTDTQIRATPLPVSGTVSTGGLTDTQLRATPVPVSGTVTATTGGLTDTQLRATPVPVSGTVTANAGSNLNTSALALDATLTGGTQKSKLVDTGGTNVASVSAAGALRVDASGVAVPITDNSGSLTVDAPVGTPAFVRLSDGAAAITALPITDNAGSLTVDAPVGTPVFARLSDGAATLVGQKAMTASLPVVLASDQASVPVAATLAAETTKVIGTVNPPALTKGTLSANGFSVQEPKDAGRNVTNYFMAGMVALTNAEVMQSLTGYKSGAAVGATATPAVVTSGKTYRINRVTISFLAASAIGGALIRLRALTSGVALIGSPLAMNWHVGVPAIFTAGAEITYNFDYPDGLEFAAGTGIAIGAIGEGADGVTGTAVGKILVSIEGYEY